MSNSIQYYQQVLRIPPPPASIEQAHGGPGNKNGGTEEQAGSPSFSEKTPAHRNVGGNGRGQTRGSYFLQSVSSPITESQPTPTKYLPSTFRYRACHVPPSACNICTYVLHPHRYVRTQPGGHRALLFSWKGTHARDADAKHISVQIWSICCCSKYLEPTLKPANGCYQHTASSVV